MRIIRRARGGPPPAPERQARPRRPLELPYPDVAELEYSALLAGDRDDWVIVTAQCRRCHALMVHCPRSGHLEVSAALCPTMPKTAAERVEKARRRVEHEERAVAKMRAPEGERRRQPERAMARAEKKLESAQASLRRAEEALATEGQCDWIPRTTRVVQGDRPWVCGVPGTVGPGDEFEVDAAEAPVRVFVGAKDGPAYWRMIPAGIWSVLEDGSLTDAVP